MVAGQFSKETVGEYLKRERESRRVTLEEISKSTRISRPYLEALERDDFRFFSRPEYIHGFLRGYARHIGLNPSEVLKRFEFQQDLSRLKGSFHQLPLFSVPGDPAETRDQKKAETTHPAPKKAKARISRSILVQIIVLVAALSFSFYLYLTLKQLDNGPGSSGEGMPVSKSSPKHEMGKEPAPPSKGISEKPQGVEPGEKPSGGSKAEAGGVNRKDSGNLERGQSIGAKKKVLGNPESKAYYLPGMKNYEKMKKGKIVEFDSEEEAVRRGFRKAAP